MDVNRLNHLVSQADDTEEVLVESVNGTLGRAYIEYITYIENLADGTLTEYASKDPLPASSCFALKQGIKIVQI